jgi:hypothetical protein
MMSDNNKKYIPARTSPGSTRSALPSLRKGCQGGSDKLSLGVVDELSLRIGTANVGTMRGRSGEVVEMAKRRRLDFCCLQETRWKGGSARTLGDFKFFWIGCDGTSGVGVLVAEKWVNRVLEVKRFSDRLMVIRVIVGKSVLSLVSVYAPQVGRSMEEKEEFYILLGNVLSAISTKEHLVVGGDLNGHVGKNVDGFEGVHYGHGFGSRNVEGEMLLEFADSMELVVANTCFKKDDCQLMTYESGGSKTVVDYILVRRKDRRMVQNVTVMHGESCLQQHKLLVCMLQVKECEKRRREVAESRCKVWKLKESTIQEAFQERIEAILDDRVIADDNVDVVWSDFRKCFMEVAEDVCGKTKGNRRHDTTWWWNDEVAEFIKEKQRLYKVYEKSKIGEDKCKIEVNKANYNTAKRLAKKAVSKAQEAERQRFGEGLDKEDMKGSVFRVAKQIVRKNRDVVGEGFVKDSAGKIVVNEKEVMEVWRTYYDKLSNEEFPWNKDTLTEVEPVCGPVNEITIVEVMSAIKKMKSNKAAGPSGVVADMVKAAGGAGARWVLDVCNSVVKEGKIPADWTKSWMVNVYKGKGDALECGSYRGIKLLEHVMKILERIIEDRVRKIVKIDDMQFGFMAGRGTTDAIFIVRQLQEKYLAKKKDLWMAFVDLEKAFDRVPREVLWWALRSLGVDEWIIGVIKAMYEDATTSVKINGRVSKEFKVRVGVHQGSVLSPLLFIIVLEALSRNFKGGLPMELLYADDLALIAETEELLVDKINRWKVGMEEKGMRVNMGKTVVMHCQSKAGQVEKSGKYPCGVCNTGVGSNSIKCTVCKAWIHKRCSGLSMSLKDRTGFRCKTCVNGSLSQSSDMLKEIPLGSDNKLKCVEKFSYLGDMIGSGGGAEEASRARVRCAWSKFRELAPILTSRGASLRIKGKIYRACVQRVIVYGSETWPVKNDDMQRLERAERRMVRWMCGVSLKHRISSIDLYTRLGVEAVADVVRRGRLRWFGHLERKPEYDWVSACRNIEVEGMSMRGRNRKTWSECVRQDLNILHLKKELAQDREQWRGLIMGNRPTRASMEKRTLSR